MPCYGPIKSFYSAVVNASGRRSLVNDVRFAYSPVPVLRPCGMCIGCKLERSRQWAMRCVHEQKLHRQNCFITLTYDRDNLPEGGTLVKRDLQLFMKRFRKQFGKGIRFYACGEYGDAGSRPHYHACIFGHDFDDRKLCPSGDPNPIFSSRSLDAVWQHKGIARVGDLTFQSAAYVARYVVKKITGDRANEHYSRVDAEGRIYSVAPEFSLMSKGIGLGWWQRFCKEVSLHDSVIINGHEVKPPRYYLEKLRSSYNVPDAITYELIKKDRRVMAKQSKDDNTPGYHGRLRTKEEIAKARLSLKGRKL